RICASRTRGIRDGVELLLVLGQHARERFELRRALVECQSAKIRSPDAARVLEHRTSIDALRGCFRDDLARRRIAQHYRSAGPCSPLSRDEASNLHGMPPPPSRPPATSRRSPARAQGSTPATDTR